MAILVRKHNLGFVHITKTGGTSMMNWLKRNQNAIHVGLKHDNADILLKQYPNADYFTICRNPYARVVSWYNFRIMRHRELLKDGENFPGCEDAGLTNEFALNEHYGNNFDEWLKRISWKKPVGYNLDYGIIQKQVSFMSQKKKPKIILHQETLNKDVNQLKKLMNIKESFPHANKSKSVDWRSYYKSDFAQEYVYEHWKDDFEYFNYEREIKW